MIDINIWIGIVIGMVMYRLLDMIEYNLYEKIVSFIKSIPYLPRTIKYHRLVKKYCEKYDISYKYSYDGDSQAHADTRNRIIQLTYPNKLTSFGAAMHEIGHIVHPVGALKGNSRHWILDLFEVNSDKLRDEICAWLWAYRNTPIKLDIHDTEMALKSYIKCASESTILENRHLLLRLDRIAGTNLAC